MSSLNDDQLKHLPRQIKWNIRNRTIFQIFIRAKSNRNLGIMLGDIAFLRENQEILLRF